ncbi:hypothetical protein RJ55_07160 [Drechmeria coniospora]|nr:hypothetical protein RJ55_07160 [Drechmeria coniospora]
MSSVTDHLPSLEARRLQLEETVNQLRKALQHWQVWDAEYEALKEEVAAASDGTNEGDELRRIHDDFEGELLHGKELDDIFGPQEQRPKEQLLNMLQRRIDYVARNINNLQKQLEVAEDDYDTAVIGQADEIDEGAEPITEIVEELDDDDNVVSYRLNQPSASVPQIRKALEKAGIEDVSDAEQQQRQQQRQQQQRHAPGATSSSKSDAEAKPATLSENGHPQPVLAAKKTAAFSDDTPMEDLSTPTPAPDVARRIQRVQQIMKTAKEQEDISRETPVIPEDDDPYDADLRQQMLKYSVGEVGAVVAELQLEGSDAEDDAEDDGFDYGDGELEEDEYESDDEDRWGRSTGRIVTDDYRQRMLELEERLGIKSRFTQQNERDDGSDDGSDDDDEGIGRIVVKRDVTSHSASAPPPPKSSIKDKQSNGKGQKGVRFSPSLDIAPDHDGLAASSERREEPRVEPLGDIVERVGPSQPTATRRPPSRFKKAQAEAAASGDIPKGPLDVPRRFLEQERDAREVPAGPEGTTLADKLVEREPSFDVAPPDEFDDSIDHNAVADEYHRMRNKFIQRQGGFLVEDETPTRVRDETGREPEPVSRFKAARLSRQ